MMQDVPRGAIRLLLVDDHEVVLRGLAEFFRSQPELVVVGTAGSAREALRAVSASVPDVALLDLRLPDMDGIALCRELRTRQPSLVCLLLSSFADEEVIVDAVLAGAAGYVVKHAPLTEVSDAVRRVARGESIIEPEVTPRVLARLRGRNPTPALEALTPQERRVLDLITEGMTNREIAQELFLAEQTVKNYVSTLLAKLGLKRGVAATTFAKERKHGSR